MQSASEVAGGSGSGTSSPRTCAELDDGPPGGLLTACWLECTDQHEWDQVYWERETYAEQAKDPLNECFMLRLAFEQCIADFTCEDLAAFNADSESSPCAEEWAALEPRYQECTRPE